MGVDLINTAAKNSMCNYGYYFKNREYRQSQRINILSSTLNKSKKKEQKYRRSEVYLMLKMPS